MKIFTLVSGDYVYGAVALINSLRRQKYVGEIVVGYEGAIDLDLKEAAGVTLVKLAPNGRWIGTRKAELLLRESDDCVFIDADCVVTSPSLLRIAESAVASRPLFCAEGLLPAADYRRRVWSDAVCERTSSHGTIRGHDVYYNSGFVVLNAQRERSLVRSWYELSESLAGHGGLGEDLRFPMADQDCLNALLQSSTESFACLSPPDVWYAASQGSVFVPVGSAVGPLLLHCTGPEKTWRHERVPDRRAHEYDRAWYNAVTDEGGPLKAPLKLSNGVRSWLRGESYGRLLQARSRWGRFVSGR